LASIFDPQSSLTRCDLQTELHTFNLEKVIIAKHCNLETAWHRATHYGL